MNHDVLHPPKPLFMHDGARLISLLSAQRGSICITILSLCPTL